MIQTTPYPEVNALLQTLLERMQLILASKLVGVYLYGSLVNGDFELETSDIDLLALTSHALDDAELDRLREMHQAFAREFSRWDDRIETAYLTLDALKHFRTQASTIANISPGEPFHTLEANQDWLVNWYMVREQGITLFGPPPQTVIPAITKAEFVATIRNHVPQWAQWINGSRHIGGQAYAIVTMCRALYTLTHSEQVSKSQAAAWAMARYPQWAALIQDALMWRAHHYRPPGDIDPEATFPETVRFVHFTINEVVQHHS